MRRLLTLVAVAAPGWAYGQFGPPGFSGVWDPEPHWEGWSVDQPFTPEGQALQDAWGPEHDTGLECIYPLDRSQLDRRGWKYGDLVEGDEVVATGRLARDGSKRIQLLRVVRPSDGWVGQGYRGATLTLPDD